MDSRTQDVFVALAHPLRRSLLEMLAKGEQPVNRLAAKYRVSRPAISQHLGILAYAGLVEARREGRVNVYTLQPDRLRLAQVWLSRYEKYWATR